MRYSLLVLSCLMLLAGCSATPVKGPKIFASGEKVAIGQLLYSVVDTQLASALGDDPANLRTPRDRFLMVQVSIANIGPKESAIPGLTLIDDGGKTYPELADGAGVARWLGVVRSVGGNQTEAGMVLFDAPAKHYRLRLTDEAEDDISIDVPLNFVHEPMRDLKSNPDAAPPMDIPAR